MGGGEGWGGLDFAGGLLRCSRGLFGRGEVGEVGMKARICTYIIIIIIYYAIALLLPTHMIQTWGHCTRVVAPHLL